jgi:hypothetical protein
LRGAADTLASSTPTHPKPQVDGPLRLHLRLREELVGQREVRRERPVRSAVRRRARLPVLQHADSGKGGLDVRDLPLQKLPVLDLAGLHQLVLAAEAGAPQEGGGEGV